MVIQYVAIFLKLGLWELHRICSVQFFFDLVQYLSGNCDAVKKFGIFEKKV